jgi:hypothetical protein
LLNLNDEDSSLPEMETCHGLDAKPDDDNADQRLPHERSQRKNKADDDNRNRNTYGDHVKMLENISDFVPFHDDLSFDSLVVPNALNSPYQNQKHIDQLDADEGRDQASQAVDEQVVA